MPVRTTSSSSLAVDARGVLDRQVGARAQAADRGLVA